jgi:hypothetical protein
MKKVLILVLTGFVVFTLVTLVFTIQYSNTLGEFSDDDNEVNDDFNNYSSNEYKNEKEIKIRRDFEKKLDLRINHSITYNSLDHKECYARK